jgi:hypothetical protein
MSNNNFVGLNNFIWWVGIVENRVDPLAIGRCQVRIFGWHSEKVTDLPTESLPWAQAMIPVNTPNTFATARVGDWVLGFFLDGEQAQMPVILGILPGLKPGKIGQPYEKRA